jgi:hypothetical protein
MDIVYGQQGSYTSAYTVCSAYQHHNGTQNTPPQIRKPSYFPQQSYNVVAVYPYKNPSAALLLLLGCVYRIAKLMHAHYAAQSSMLCSTHMQQTSSSSQTTADSQAQLSTDVGEQIEKQRGDQSQLLCHSVCCIQCMPCTCHGTVCALQQPCRRITSVAHPVVCTTSLLHSWPDSTLPGTRTLITASRTLPDDDSEDIASCLRHNSQHCYLLLLFATRSINHYCCLKCQCCRNCSPHNCCHIHMCCCCCRCCSDTTP